MPEVGVLEKLRNVVQVTYVDHLKGRNPELVNSQREVQLYRDLVVILVGLRQDCPSHYRIWMSVKFLSHNKEEPDWCHDNNAGDR